jgi:hypothetical protein
MSLPRLSLAQLRPTLRSTTVCTCRRYLKTSHRPHGSLAYMPQSTLIFQFGSIFGSIPGICTCHACTLPIAPMGKSLTCLPSRFHNCERFGQLQWVRATETLKTSLRPDGRLTFCSLFAGRRCCRLGWHSDHLIVHDQWEHRKRGAHSCSKFPIAPMGDSCFAHCLQGGGVSVYSGTVTITSSSIYGNTASAVRDQVQKFPSPPWETYVLLVACRAVAVSLSGMAQCQS